MADRNPLDDLNRLFPDVFRDAAYNTRLNERQSRDAVVGSITPAVVGSTTPIANPTPPKVRNDD